MPTDPQTEHLDSADFQVEWVRAARLCNHFLATWSGASSLAHRSPVLGVQSLTFHLGEHVIECAVAIQALTQNGMLTAARRELRHLLEHSVKVTAVDQRHQDTALDERLALLTKSIPRSSINVGPLTYFGLSDPSIVELRSLMHSEFSTLSSYVHPSATQFQERLDAAAKGHFVGFESTKQVRQLNDHVRRVYDIALVHLFQVLGFGLTGDLFVNVFDDMPQWAFHRARFVPEISHAFDYKAERARYVGPQRGVDA